MKFNHKIQNKVDLLCLLESMESLDTFEDTYELQRTEILSSIKSRLELDTEARIQVINDLDDYIDMTEEELFLLGVFTGIRLIKAVRRV